MKAMLALMGFLVGVALTAIAAFAMYFAPLGVPGEFEMPAYEGEGGEYTPPDSRNAAIRYGTFNRRLGRFTGPDGVLYELPPIGSIEKGERIGDEQAETFLDQCGRNEQLHDASRMSVCDWQPALEDGSNAELYWLGDMQDYMKILLYSGEIAADRGDHDRALREYAAALRVAQHVAQDGFFVSGNVSSKWAGRVARRAAERVAFGRVSEDARREWIEAIDRFDEDDPFGFRAGVETNVEWNVRLGGFEILNAEGSGSGNGITVPDEPIEPRSAADRAMVEEMMAGARRWKADMLGAWGGEPERIAETVREVDRRVSAGAYAPNTGRTLTALSAMAAQEAGAAGALAEARALAEAEG